METERKIEIALAVTMLTSGVSPRYISAQDINPPSSDEKFPNVSTFSQVKPSPVCKAENPMDLTYSIIDDANDMEKSFDVSIFDFDKLAPYKLERVENLPVGFAIETVDTTTLYIVPTNYDKQIEISRDLKQVNIQPGMNFELAQKRTIENSDGEKIEIGILRNTFGDSFYVAALPLSFTSSDGEITSFVKKNDEIIRSVSYITTESDCYPNKVMNIIAAFSNISEFQDLNGEFKKDETYSHISMIGLDRYNKLLEYKEGFNSSRNRLLAGGVCVSATEVSTLFHLIEGSKLEHFRHTTMYAQGPFAPLADEVDATVSVWKDENGELQKYDLTYIPGENGYMKFDVTLIPANIDFNLTAQDGVGGLSDVVFIMSLSYTNEKPESQTSDLLYTLNEYELYRESKHGDFLLNAENGNMKRYSLKSTGMMKLVSLLYTSK
jgi:hypothetical protein